MKLRWIIVINSTVSPIACSNSSEGFSCCFPWCRDKHVRITTDALRCADTIGARGCANCGVRRAVCGVRCAVCGVRRLVSEVQTLAYFNTISLGNIREICPFFQSKKTGKTRGDVFIDFYLAFFFWKIPLISVRKDRERLLKNRREYIPEKVQHFGSYFLHEKCTEK